MLNDAKSSPPQLNEIHWENVDYSSNPQDFATYLQYMGSSKVAGFLQERILELLPLSNHCRVLDAGCGLGANSRAVAKRIGSGGLVTGIDKSSVMIESAKSQPLEEGSADLIYDTGDLYELPYAADSFDAILTDRVFIHLSNPEKALSEFRRVLKAGGHVVMSETDWSAFYIEPASEFTKLLIEEKKNNFANPSFGGRMAEYLEQAGFTVLKHKGLFHENTEYDFSWRLLNLEGAGHRLIEKGMIREEDFEAIKTSMHQAEEAGKLKIDGAMYFGLAVKEEAL